MRLVLVVALLLAKLDFCLRCTLHGVGECLNKCVHTLHILLFKEHIVMELDACVEQVDHLAQLVASKRHRLVVLLSLNYLLQQNALDVC